MKTRAPTGNFGSVAAPIGGLWLQSLVSTFDKVLGAPEREGPRLSFPVGRTTAREIIEARVRVEVERYNAGEEAPSRGAMFAPADTETALNGPRRTGREKLDVERQIERALAAVEAGRVIVLFNGAQVEDIDLPLAMTPVSEARFVRLVALVGG